MQDYLLIHGAWHGAWCWDTLAAQLRSMGHTVTAIDLPGMGADLTPAAAVTLQSWIDRTVQALHDSPEPVVLVGHSMAGMVITGAAAALPAKVARMVYVCAFLPLPGEALFELASRPEGAATLVEQHPSADGLCTVVPPDNARITFYGLCSPAATDAAVARLCPLPIKTVLEPLPAAAADLSTLPRHYVECTEDCAIPIALQRFMWGRQPGIVVHTLNSDHSPFVSQPHALAALL
ncbi:MAG: alpha/beta fold hydrolase [Proteobacteria bacterium]|nr:alpha/beta fold hydrolase [Pseudomonadota bacterium]